MRLLLTAALMIGTLTGPWQPIVAQAPRCSLAADLQRRVAELAGHVDSEQSRATLDSMAILFAKSQCFVEARQIWVASLEKRPNDYDFLFNAGLMSEFLREFGVASDFFQKALDAAPTKPEAQSTIWHLGVAYSHLGRSKLARELFVHAGSTDSSDASAWGFAAVVAYRSHDYADAAALWERALLADAEHFQHAQSGERKMYLEAVRRVGRQLPKPVLAVADLTAARQRANSLIRAAAPERK